MAGFRANLNALCSLLVFVHPDERPTMLGSPAAVLFATARTTLTASVALTPPNL